MNIKQQRDHEKLTVFIEGDIDTSTATALVEDLQIDGVTDLVLDLGKVNYVSSAGLRALLLLQKGMNARKGKMTVRHVNDEIMETFRLTGMTDVLAIAID